MVLVFVGAKMLLTDVVEVPVGLSLGVIALVQAAAVVASLLVPRAAAARVTVQHDPLDPAPADPAGSAIEPTRTPDS